MVWFSRCAGSIVRHEASRVGGDRKVCGFVDNALSLGGGFSDFTRGTDILRHPSMGYGTSSIGAEPRELISLGPNRPEGMFFTTAFKMALERMRVVVVSPGNNRRQNG